MPGKCKFNDVWLEKEAYKEWLVCEVKDEHKARCSFCARTFDITSMGEAALRSHMKSKKHAEAVAHLKTNAEKANTISTFFSKKGKGCVTEGPRLNVQNEGTSSNSSGTLLTTTRTEATWKAEIMWTMRAVECHYSTKSCELNSDLFASMFPDSAIAKSYSYSCGERKSAYLCNHGLAPYFRQDLSKTVTDAATFVLLFDESMNDSLQSKQMDLHVRFFNEDNMVMTRYMDSIFMGHGRAHDCIAHFKTLTTNMNLKNLIQISMDGPNVNHKFYKDFGHDVLANVTDKKLIDIGTCSLHNVHNAFRGGFDATTWDIDGTLRGMYRLMKDSPARREDFEDITGCDTYALKFCPHRWVENIRVAERALRLFPNLAKFVQTIEREKQYTTPTCKAFSTVKEACKESLTPARLQFFVSVAKGVSPYLVKLQTDKPMVPFLGDEIQSLLKTVLHRIVKPEVLNKLDSKIKLVKYDLPQNDLLFYNKIDMGFSATRLLSKLTLSERQKMDFQMQCRYCLVKIAKKFLVKCPLQSTLVRNASCFSPCVISRDIGGDTSKVKLRRLLTYLVDIKRVEEKKCDDITRQFELFSETEVTLNFADFTNYNITSQRLDEFLSSHMNEDKYADLWHVAKLIIVLSHGQATVERGFSVNSKITVENKKEGIYTAQRIVYDAVKQAGGCRNVKVTPSMIRYAKASRIAYEQHLHDEKEKSKKCVKQSAKRKNLDELTNEKKRICVDINAFEASSDEMAQKAEATSNRDYFVKFNLFRKAIKEKQAQVDKLKESI